MTGTNYEDFGGTLTFAAGTESGTTQDVTVSTTATTGADVSRSVVDSLTATGAQPPAIESDDPGRTPRADRHPARQVPDPAGRPAPGHRQGGTIRHPDQVPAALARAATTGAPDTGPDSLAESLTSIIRDVVRARLLATTGTPSQGVSKLIAGADGSLTSGDVVTAVAQLLSAWKLVS